MNPQLVLSRSKDPDPVLHETKSDNAMRDDCVLKIFSVAKFAGDSLKSNDSLVFVRTYGRENRLPHTRP